MASRSTASGPRSQQNFMSHRGYLYFKIAFALCLLAVIAYFASDPTPVANGGTVVGYTLGTISLLIIVWLSFLGVRKRLMTSGKWSLRGWTSAHVYLGLSLIILATLLSRFKFTAVKGRDPRPELILTLRPSGGVWLQVEELSS